MGYWCGTGGGGHWKHIFEKTRVGFGRTEVSIPLFETFFELYKMGMISEAPKIEP